MLKQAKMSAFLRGDIEIEQLVHFFDSYNFTKEEIKSGGIVYTPKSVSDYIVQEIDPKRNETVFEPSAGHGIFIFSLLEKIQEKYLLDPNELKKYFLKNVYAQDIIEKNIFELKELLVLYFLKLGIEIEPRDMKNLTVGDTLLSKKRYHIIIGNPPYIRVKNLESEYVDILRKNYISCEKGNIDIYYAFMELAHNNSDRYGFIVPNSWLQNVGAQALRNILKKSLVEILDFKEKKIFESASTYTSIIIGSMLAEKTFTVKTAFNSGKVVMSREHLNESRWTFSSPVDRKKTGAMGIIKYHTPIATLRDKIYITDLLSDNNKDLVPFYKLSKVKSARELKKEEKKILFPYKLVNAKYKIKEELELEKKTLIYLKDNREELEKRDKGKTQKYESWYAYGRKQGINTYGENSVLIVVPGMISLQYIFFSISKKEMPEHFLFSSGFLLEISKEKEKKLLDFLNGDDFKNVLKSDGKVWKGKDEKSSYYSMSVVQLKQLFD